MADIFLGKSDTTTVVLESRFGNRHGLIAGATGSGKSVSLMLLAEAFSKLGTPVFLADVKGDLAGLAAAAAPASDKLKARLATLGIEQTWTPAANPVVFWDIYGVQGAPVRATLEGMGATLLARIMELSPAQTGVLEIVFKLATDKKMPLVDLKDLRALLAHVSDNAKTISNDYGLVSSTSVAAVQRALLQLESQGADQFFGEPPLELADLMRQDLSGRGIINLLAADKLILKPKLYSTFLLWLLSELFEKLPEVGDLDQPKLVFFFDEAHLLFDDCPPALRQRVEQVIRLIRSKGVGVYFCSQNPTDIPDEILGQLGNRIQHVLRAFTPKDQKAVKAAADTFAPNPALNVTTVIGTLGVGEALVSTLRGKGVPSPVEKVLMATPTCRLGTLSPEERQQVRQRSPVDSKYNTRMERESASEMLAKQQAEAPVEAPTQKQTKAARQPAESSPIHDALLGNGRREGMLMAFLKQIMRMLGRELVNSLLGKRRR